MKYFKKNLLSFFLVILILFGLQSWTMADDISDFQIEGMSIGDSLLSYYKEDEILNTNIMYYPNSKKFYQVAFLVEGNLYDALNINLKKDDKKYKIYAIKGVKDFDNKLAKCLKHKTNVIKDVVNILENTKENKGESDWDGYYGQSISYQSGFEINNGSIFINCIKWDKNNDTVKSAEWVDTFNVEVSTNEWRDWLNLEAYN